ncbi:MAG: ABC transporter permease [Bacteroidales bacterium]|nr:ABC transporter permease [Bacteroidales bacterium]
MFRNYLKIAFRVLYRQRTYALINIIGLTVGIASFILILLYIQYELGFDKHIPDIDNLYRCVEIQHAQGVGEQHVAVTMGPLGKALVADFPEITKQVRMMNWGKNSVEYNDQQYNQDFVVFADPTVFELFNVKLIKGDTATALNEIKSIVISEKMADKVFGSIDNAMGKTILFNGKEGYLVKGVMENQPEQSHFPLEMLISFATAEQQYEWLKGWGSNSMATYVKVKEGTDIAALEEKFHDFVMKQVDPEDEAWVWQLYLQPVRDIHLKSGHIKFQVANNNQGNLSMVYVFGLIAFLIILVASINFINLAIARSVKRAKEVGMRKVLGANHWNLMYQFLGESLVITFISIAFSLIIIELLLPSYNRILGTDFTIDFVHNAIFNIGLILILFIVSLLAGSYPAFYLSRFRPIRVLKNSVENQRGGSGYLSKGLVTLQFVFSIGMLFSIGLVYSQFHFIMNKDLGLNYKQVVSIPLYNHNSEEDVQRIRDAFMSVPGVADMSHVSFINGVSGSQSTLNIDDSAKTRITCRIGYVDYNFFPLMDIPILEGRNFSKDYALDENEAVILNQAAVNFLGWDQPIGKTFQPIMDTVHKRKVIGVIADYHYYSLHSKIEPAAYIVRPSQSYSLAIKLNPGSSTETVNALEEKWGNLFPGVPFEYQYATDYIKNMYRDEENTLTLFSYFTLLSILISCLGLYGLTALMTERRTREIGVRKVFGGSVGRILMLLVKDYLRLIIVAAVVALPVSWYLMSGALENFAYRIGIAWYFFILPVIVVGIFAFLTTAYHAIRAASMNPAKAIRYE